MSELWLSKEQFERLSPLLPIKVRGVARIDGRAISEKRPFSTFNSSSIDPGSSHSRITSIDLRR